MGKGEIACYKQFLLLPQSFQKTCIAWLVWERVNPLPNGKIFALTNLKAFEEDKLSVSKMAISICDRVENNVGKGIKNSG